MDIVNIKNIVVFGARLHTAVKKAGEDRKIDANDIFYLIPALQALTPAVQGINMIIPEFKDLDSAEVEELVKVVQQEDPALGSKVVAIQRIKVCLELAVAILKTYKAFSIQEAPLPVA